ncbi:MAG: hypothetical protein OXC83_04985 [Chloroflexi bacterium]|nr:hypothetical protein [Chloroflexota bacterium]
MTNITFWSAVSWGAPIFAVFALVAGNRYEVAHHPLPEGLERVWGNSEIWSIPGAVILLASAWLSIVYLDRLLHAGVKNGVIYAFAAWVLMRISWLQSITWLRSSQLGDDWRQVFVTGPSTIEISIVLAVVALIVATFLAKSTVPVWLSRTVPVLALPAIVQYWMAGELIALLDGILSLALFGYVASKFVLYRRSASIRESESEDSRCRNVSMPKYVAIRIVFLGLVFSTVIGVVAIYFGIGSTSIGSSVIVITTTLLVCVSTLIAIRLMNRRFDTVNIAVTNAIVSLIVVSLLINGSWIPSKIAHPDFDGWLLLGSQTVLMAIVGCSGLVFALFKEEWNYLRPFFATLTIPMLGYLKWWDFPAIANNFGFTSWKLGNVLPISAHAWFETSIVLSFMLAVMWYVFGPGVTRSE